MKFEEFIPRPQPELFVQYQPHLFSQIEQAWESVKEGTDPVHVTFVVRKEGEDLVKIFNEGLPEETREVCHPGDWLQMRLMMGYMPFLTIASAALFHLQWQPA
jgi:hypothetical protein